jgi:hypothetical protein
MSTRPALHKPGADLDVDVVATGAAGRNLVQQLVKLRRTGHPPWAVASQWRRALAWRGRES